jgi:hypothetical protein
MWNEENWTLVSMPISSTRAQWDEGLRTVRQFNDLLRVLPPTTQAAIGPVPRHRGQLGAAPGRPLTQSPPAETAGDTTRARHREPVRPTPPRNGQQAHNYQR